MPRSQLSFRVSIHESAEVAAAHRFWGEVVGVSVDSLLRPTIKRHRPRTVRHNLGKDYHGCLVVKVYRSAELYRRSRVGGEAVSSR